MQVLPLAILDDLMECIVFLSSLPSDPDRRGGIVQSVMVESVSGMDADLLVSICLCIMRSNGLIKSPHARWSRYVTADEATILVSQQKELKTK